MPDGELTLVDGLLASNSPEVLVPLAHRLPLVVLVHLPLEGPRERAVLSAAAAVLTTSTWTRDRLLALYGLDVDRVHVAEPGGRPIAAGARHASRRELLCVAAVTPMKGHDVLVAALATLPELPWRCTCAGPVSPDPDFVERVTEQARRAGIDRRIHLVGPLDRTTLDQTYAAADVLVHPSRVETYGMVVTEAAGARPPRHRHVGGRRPRRPRARRRPRRSSGRQTRAARPRRRRGRPGRGPSRLVDRRRPPRTTPAESEERRLHLHPWSRTAEQVSAVLATLAGTDEITEPD